MLKETLCGYHDPKVKADHAWACLVFRKVEDAKPSATSALQLAAFCAALILLDILSNIAAPCRRPSCFNY